jgi:hypothetical protein
MLLGQRGAISHPDEDEQEDALCTEAGDRIELFARLQVVYVSECGWVGAIRSPTSISNPLSLFSICCTNIAVATSRFHARMRQRGLI